MKMISASKAKNFAWQMIEVEFPSLTRKTAINQDIISYFNKSKRKSQVRIREQE